jgi:hypothetical protein
MASVSSIKSHKFRLTDSSSPFSYSIVPHGNCSSQERRPKKFLACKQVFKLTYNDGKVNSAFKVFPFSLRYFSILSGFLPF